MKIAVTATGRDVSSNVDPRFGRAKYFILLDSDTDEVVAHDNAQNLNAAQGAGIQAAETVSRLGAEAVITGNVGPKAFRALNAAGIKIYLCGDGTVTDLIRKFKAGELKETDKSNVEGALGMKKGINFVPIGWIRSEHTEAEKCPIQPAYAEGCIGKAEILPEYEEGLRDLEGFSHIYLVYLLHKAGLQKLTVKPFLQDVEHGIFSTRAPCRPNPIGLSIVRLVRREGNILHLDGLDILDGTPLLDIKPYTARFDRIENTRNGWQDDVDEETAMRRGKRGYKKEIQ